MPKPAGILEDPGPSVAIPILQHSEVHISPNQMCVGPNIMEMLRSMPNNNMLKELLESSTQSAQLCREKGGQSSAFPNDGYFYEDFATGVGMELGCAREFIHYAYKLKHVVEGMASMSLSIMDMANVFANMTPSLLELALGCDKLVLSIQALDGR
jgi:hypothetical protein